MLSSVRVTIRRVLDVTENSSFCRDMFTAPLRSNARGADHRKHRSSITARVHFRGNVFTEPLPSNELSRLSGVMSQYVLYSCQQYLQQMELAV
jgi:hypothetical protein